MKAEYLVRFYHPDVGPRTGLRSGDTVFDISSRFSSILEPLSNHHSTRNPAL